ncbi:DNA gyrase subunit A [Nocardioides aurantiacus]|nr:DNA gyrase subunit A [Nocardioides aurantiacus]
MASNDDGEQIWAKQERLTLLDALIAATSRRDEVFAVLSRSEDPERAVSELRQLLSIEEIPARAIVDLQLRRFTSGERQKLADMRAELLSELD